MTNLKYHLITLGCPKNQVDSDGIEMTLQNANVTEAPAVTEADVLIVNTCGFLEAAKEESISVLTELADGKRDNQMLIAAGCLAQRNGQEVLQRVAGVDGLLGTRRWMDVMELVRGIRGHNSEKRSFERYDMLGESSAQYGASTPALLDDPAAVFDAAFPRPPVTGGSAYLKISDGCNAPCAFCTIPSFKGKLRSRPMNAIVDEANALVRAGAKELIVVAQDTTDYGRDWSKQGWREPNSLAQLLAAICRRTSDDLKWLRIMYAYPGHVSDELIRVMADEEKIVPYLDIPLQHGDSKTLTRMRRPSRVSMVYEHIAKLREAMPDIALRTTFIVGFPGETETEFSNLLEFIEEIEFDKVGAFTFSPEPGTPAASLADPVPAELQDERYGRLMEVQQAISLRKNQAQIGRMLDVLIEGEGEYESDAQSDGGPLLIGRSYRDAPEVDGLVLVPGISGVPAGEMIEVHINGAMEYDLVGEPLLAETFSSRNK